VVAFSFLKFIQIFSLPFFLGTIAMGDNYSIDSMTTITNNLTISCLTTLAWFGFNLYLA
jgi:hypothetical protein